MKRIKYLLFSCLLFGSFIGVVHAAPSATLSVSSSTVENGKKVTASVTLKNAAAWNIKIISSGNTNGCSQSFADATQSGNNSTQTFRVTCKATSIGAIGFTLTGDATSSDGSNVNVSGSKRVTVVEPRKASENNYLKSLTIDGYNLSPEFNEEVSDYTVSVPSTVNQVTINAKVKDKYAKVSGIGTVDVNEGANNFTIVVTAENGSTRNYNVIVNVEDLNPIVIDIDGKKYTIIKNLKNIETPTLFTISSVVINDVEVPSFKSDVSNFILIALKDENGQIVYAIKNEDNTYNLYKTVEIGNVLLYIIDKDINIDDYNKTTINIGKYEINAYQDSINNDYYLIYGMNVSNNEESWYKYDKKENTLQRFEIKEEQELKDNLNDYLIIIIIFGVALVLAIIVAICSIIVSNKRIKRIMMNIQSKGNVVINSNDKKKNEDIEKTKEIKKEEIQKENKIEKKEKKNKKGSN